MRYSLALALAVTLGCTSNERTDAGVPSARPDAAASTVDDRGVAPPDGGEVAHDDASVADAVAPDAEPVDSGEADSGAGDAGATGPTFTADVFPMFEAIGCSRVACHGSIRAQGGAVVYLPDARTAYTDLFERPSIRGGNLLVRPGEPERSVLYIHGRDENIPVGDLTADGLALIGAWITAGAPFGDDVVLTPLPQHATCSLVDRPGSLPLPDACMPRCTAETWAGVADCRNQADVVACQGRVIAADTSTPTQLDFGPELGAMTVDCGTCLDLQTESCFLEHCLTDYLAATRCRILDQRPTACTAEINQVRTCAAGSTAMRTCQATRDALCVGR